MKETSYDKLDAIIDKVEKESAYHQSPILRSVAQELRDIRDRLPDEIDEITIIVNKEKHLPPIEDVLVNGKQTKCYCVVPKDQTEEYLEKRFSMKKEIGNTMKYTELIGKKVHILKQKYKKYHEYDGIIEEVEGKQFKIKQENGESIWIGKLRKNDSMTFNEND